MTVSWLMMNGVFTQVKPERRCLGTAFVILSEDSLFPRPDLIHMEMTQDCVHHNDEINLYGDRIPHGPYGNESLISSSSFLISLSERGKERESATPVL